jgi:hypothetical protein
MELMFIHLLTFEEENIDGIALFEKLLEFPTFSPNSRTLFSKFRKFGEILEF